MLECFLMSVLVTVLIALAIVGIFFVKSRFDKELVDYKSERTREANREMLGILADMTPKLLDETMKATKKWMEEMDL